MWKLQACRGWYLSWGLSLSGGGLQHAIYQQRGGPQSHLSSPFSNGLFFPWIEPDGCHPQSNIFQNWEAFHKNLGIIHGVGLKTSFRQDYSDVELSYVREVNMKGISQASNSSFSHLPLRPKVWLPYLHISSRFSVHPAEPIIHYFLTPWD